MEGSLGGVSAAIGVTTSLADGWLDAINAEDFDALRRMKTLDAKLVLIMHIL